ncbi:unnamed protein product, partial [Laminaria digitata]
SGRLANAGNAVRDGIAAAYLDNRIALAGGSNASVELRFYDTAEDDMTSLLDNALAAGSSAIIGPLARGNVEELMALQPRIPVLALNYVERSQTSRTETPVQTNSLIAGEIPVRESQQASQQRDAQNGVTQIGNADSTARERYPATQMQMPGAPAAFLQLALAVEDEASEIVRQLRRDGHERIAVLHASSSWAERASATLAQAW